jgi:ferric-dicitrate binding protein FerR (iron transport regulator)
MVVSDIGTQFEVRREEGTIAVTLVEGKVRVARGLCPPIWCRAAA